MIFSGFCSRIGLTDFLGREYLPAVDYQEWSGELLVGPDDGDGCQRDEGMVILAQTLHRRATGNNVHESDDVELIHAQAYRCPGELPLSRLP